jgi:hypothetical protein
MMDALIENWSRRDFTPTLHEHDPSPLHSHRMNITVDTANFLSLRAFLGKGLGGRAELLSDRDPPLPSVEEFLERRLASMAASLRGIGMQKEGEPRIAEAEINPLGGGRAGGRGDDGVGSVGLDDVCPLRCGWRFGRCTHLRTCVGCWVSSRGGAERGEAEAECVREGHAYHLQLGGEPNSHTHAHVAP